jgi:tetratricopeptide (TPR) repeat protein
MWRLAAPLFLVLFTSGCVHLQLPALDKKNAQAAPTRSAGDAVSQAEKLAAQGRWGEAIGILGKAEKAYPADQRIVARLLSIQQRWEAEQSRLKDRLLLSDAQNERERIAVLGTLSVAQPDDLLLIARRLYWKEVLNDKAERLTRCAERHVADNTVLSRRCFNLASTLVNDDAIEQRLAQVGNLLKVNEQSLTERQRAAAARQRRAKVKVLLGKARAAIDAGDYRGSLDVLEKAAALQPDNREVSGLQEKARSLISPQVEALIRLGDQLYLSEQLDAAVAAWQAAASLRPNDDEVTSRIERAKTVLNRLQMLRAKQQSIPEQGAEATPR